MGEGEHAPGLFIVLHGRVRLSRTAADGREQVVAMLGPGDTLNARADLRRASQPRRSARHERGALHPAAPRRPANAYRRPPDLALAALHQMAEQLRELMVLVEDLAFRSVRAALPAPC